MKKYASYLMAGVAGGLVSLAGSRMLPQENVVYAQPEVQRTFTSERGEKGLPDFTEAAEISMPSVVHIVARQVRTTASRPQYDNPFRLFFGDDMFESQPKEGTGSGVIYSQDGYIITNNHVVDFADEVEVILYDKRKFNATVVGRDPTTDLAVLKIEASGLPVLENANSDLLKVGEWVVAVGNPFNLTSTVTAGIVSAKGRNISIIDETAAIEAFIQTDAAVNPGNSGGALVDTRGRLVGINTAIASYTGSYSGYSFAIPVNIMTKIASDLIEFGTAQRGFMGVQITDLDNDLADEIGVNITEGVYVDRIVSGGAAELAGILDGDIIVSADGKEVKTVPQLQEIVGRKRPGDLVSVVINRKGKEHNLAVTLQE